MLFSRFIVYLCGDLVALLLGSRGLATLGTSCFTAITHKRLRASTLLGPLERLNLILQPSVLFPRYLLSVFWSKITVLVGDGVLVLNVHEVMLRENLVFRASRVVYASLRKATIALFARLLRL
jgi:hypothetical protein